MRAFRVALPLMFALAFAPLASGCEQVQGWLGSGTEPTGEQDGDGEADAGSGAPAETEEERRLRLEREKAELARLEAERQERERLAAEERKRKLEAGDALVARWADELEAKKGDRNMFAEHQGLTEDDPWGKQLRVRYEGEPEGEVHELEVRSAGPDGVFGNDDDLVRTRTTEIEHSWWERNGRLTVIALLWLFLGFVASFGLTNRHHRRRDEQASGIDLVDVLLIVGGMIFAPLAILVWIFLAVLEAVFA